MLTRRIKHRSPEAATQPSADKPRARRLGDIVRRSLALQEKYDGLPYELARQQRSLRATGAVPVRIAIDMPHEGAD